MTNDKDLKLVKCPKCGKAFYIKIKSKGNLELTCPYCEKDVTVKLNGGNNNGST